MKKSEVQKKIQTLLNNLEEVEITNKLKSQIILEEIISCGMLPPLIRKLVYSTVNSDGLSGKFESVQDVNEWEHES